MAGMTPVMIATAVAGTAATAATAAEVAKPSAALDTGALKAYRNRMAEINARENADERKRKDNLKRLSAAQVARFAARGISPDEGSAGAVLKGLKSASDIETEEQAQLAKIARDRASENLDQGADSGLLSKRSNHIQDNLAKLLAAD